MDDTCASIDECGQVEGGFEVRSDRGDGVVEGELEHDRRSRRKIPTRGSTLAEPRAQKKPTSEG